MSTEAARLGFDRGAQVFIVTVGAVVGVAAGLAIPSIATWISDVPWVPFQGPLTLLGSLTPAWVLPVAGAALGLGFAVYVIYDQPVLFVDEDQIEVHASGDVRRITREQVVGIFREAGKIVVEGEGGRTLFRGEVEGSRALVRQTFVSRGYPWEAE